jgi:hypothetical protein
MSEALNVNKLTLNAEVRARAFSGKPGASRPRQSAPFLKGPIPLAWIERAACLPGKALQVAIALRFRCGIERSACVKVTNVLLAKFGVDRHAKARALRQLEAANLVAVTRKRGGSPMVTVLEV